VVRTLRPNLKPQQSSQLKRKPLSSKRKLTVKTQKKLSDLELKRSKTKCAAAAFANAKVRKTSHIHAVVASQSSVV
jgi:hypothetical protein